MAWDGGRVSPSDLLLLSTQVPPYFYALHLIRKAHAVRFSLTVLESSARGPFSAVYVTSALQKLSLQIKMANKLPDVKPRPMKTIARLDR